MKQRFLIIAWPDDHDEDLSEHAGDIRDMLDLAQVGGAQVIGPIPDALHARIAADLGDRPTNPRVLVTVRGGMANYVADDGVQVEVFDWDDFDASTVHVQHEMTLPPEWADLADQVDVPCEGSPDEGDAP